MSNFIFRMWANQTSVGLPSGNQTWQAGRLGIPFFDGNFSFQVYSSEKKIIIIINQYYSSINNYKWFIFFACCFSDQGVEKFQLNSQVWARQDHHLKEGRGICLARSLSVFFWMLVPLVNCWWNTTGRWMLAGKCNEHGKCTWTFHERSRSTLLKHNKQLASLWIPGLDRVLVSLI